MRRLSHTVNYDFEHDTFYKVNPQTGKQQLAYVNGEPLKHFRPNVTGIDYHLRKSADHTKQTHTNFRTIQTERPNNRLPTIDIIPNKNHITEASFILPKTLKHQQTNSPIHNHRQISLRTTRFNHHKSGFLLDVDQGEMSRQKSQEKIKQDLLNTTLSNYTKLLRQKSIENHSPKNGVPGGEPLKDPLQTLCTTLTHFHRKESSPLENQTANQSRKTIVARRMESNSQKKKRVSKQRQLYQLFHPVSKEREERRDAAQRQRKKNLKLLQQLFIRNKNRATSHIYYNP